MTYDVAGMSPTDTITPGRSSVMLKSTSWSGTDSITTVVDKLLGCNPTWFSLHMTPLTASKVHFLQSKKISLGRNQTGRLKLFFLVHLPRVIIILTWLKDLQAGLDFQIKCKLLRLLVGNRPLLRHIAVDKTALINESISLKAAHL